MTAVAEGGVSHFDSKTSLALHEALGRDLDRVRQIRARAGEEMGSIIGIRARQLDSLGIFPQLQVVRFTEDREVKISTQPLILIGHLTKGEPLVLPDGYEATGVNIVVDPRGRISSRTVYEKDGVMLTSILGGTDTPPEDICLIGSEALAAIQGVNRSALENPQIHDPAGK